MSVFVQLLWLVPLLPFVGFLVNGLLGRRISRPVVRAVACGVLGASFVVALGASPVVLSDWLDSSENVAALEEAGVSVNAEGRSVEITLWQWLSGGERHGGRAATGAFLSSLDVPVGLYLDPLAAILMLVVTGVGTLIHLYASSYMWEEEGYWRFFTYLNLFVAMMLVLVMGSSFVVTFVGWEGVGLCSYLLIGFHYKQTFPPFAGMKAFVVNRIGDFGFLLGMLVLLLAFGTLQYSELFPRMAAAEGWVGSNLALAAALLLFVGAVGKSAQIPLYTWLPDAMAGPTPVSALIHAATMVTAGVYLVIRSNVLFQAAPTASLVVAVVGVVTALFAATIALVQVDIKKVLAYSTVSQLGYMFLAVGVGAYGAGLFHLVTHAFFKALLFLGAGSVSHGLGGELDLRRMGGLRKVMPHTWVVMLVATAAIAGIPLLSGFWSKDAILAAALGSAFSAAQGWTLWAIGMLTALLTAFYMFRLYFLTFHGEPRWGEDVHPHESPWLMLGPLYVLAALSALGGLILHEGLPAALAPVEYPGTLVSGLEHAHPWWLIVSAIGVAVAGTAWAWSWYGRESDAPSRWAESFSGAYGLLRGKYRVDEAYDALFVKPFIRLARWTGGFDRWVVDGLVEGAGIGTTLTGEAFRYMSSGRVRTYALAVFIGAVGVTCWLITR